MTISTFDLNQAERIIIRTYPIRTVLKSAYLGYIVLVALIITLTVTLGFNSVPPIFFIAIGVIIVIITAVLLWVFSIVDKLKSKSAMLFSLLAFTGFGMLGISIPLYPLLILSTTSGTTTDLAINIIGMVVKNSFLCWMSFDAGKGFMSIARASNEEKLVLAEPERSILSANAFKEYLGIPSITKFVSNSPRLLVQGRFLAPSVFFSLAVYIVTTGLPKVFDSIYPYGGAKRETRISGNEAIVASLVILICAVLISILFIYLSNFLLDRARLKTRTSIVELTRVDQRRPILFLRAFRDDQVTLVKPNYSLFGKLLSFGMKRDNLDHIILEEGTKKGPVVALGNPKDKIPPFGAARGYYDESNWQGAVSDLAKYAEQIVICIDNTSSIWWEVDHIIRCRHEAKTLFLFHPKYQDRTANVQIWCSLLEHLQLVIEDTGTSLRNMPRNASILGFFIDKDNLIRCGISSTFSREAYFAMVRLFLRSGVGEREALFR